MLSNPAPTTNCGESCLPAGYCLKLYDNSREPNTTAEEKAHIIVQGTPDCP